MDPFRDAVRPYTATGCQVSCALQISRSGGHSLAGLLWAWLLNALNLADAGLHVWYMALFALRLC